jgi:hypothetical protein
MEKAKPPTPRPPLKDAPYGSKRAKSYLKYTQRMRRNPDWYERDMTVVPPKVVTKEDLIKEEADKKD